MGDSKAWVKDYGSFLSIGHMLLHICADYLNNYS